jgi:O-antigen/teichoic acid export membrane protein
MAVEERFDLQGRSLREHTARGVVINAGFHVAIAVLGLAQRFAVAAFITVSEFGLWGIVLSILMTLYWLKEVGIGEKFVQQDEADQVVAFQKAFTLELLYTACFCVFVFVTLPVFALLYGNSEIILPAAVLTLCLLGGALQTPIWISFREMRFVRQRSLEAVNPVVSTAIMVPLAAAGAGYWSIVIGIVVGSFAGAAVALATCPYPIALRFERGTLREYVRFSAPLLFSGLAGIIIIQGTMLAGNYAVGLAGLGALTLAASLATFSDRVDQIISRTVYPAVCAVKDRRELLFETFTKSNRLALMFGLPFGIGLLLFAPDLIEFVLGDRWEPAVGLLQALGLMVGIRQIAFNWSLFYNATGNTRPVGVMAAILVGVFLIVTVPAIAVLGLDGYIVGTAVSLAVELCVRSYYLRRFFPGFGMMRHLVRAFAPSIPAVGVVVVVRALETGPRTAGQALLELGLYLATTALATLWFERRLLREILGYVRGRAGPGDDAVSPVGEAFAR